MKKKKLLISLIVVGICIAVAIIIACIIAIPTCKDNDNGNGDNTGSGSTPSHTHSYTETVIAPTCTQQGYTLHTCTCGDNYKDSYISATGHSEVVDNAVASTCTQTGLTEGKHCSVCNTVITAQTTIPALGHTEVTDKAIEATCETDGKTQGSHCEVCDIVLVEKTTISALGHNYINGKCLRCGKEKPATDGLNYTLSTDKTYYSVAGYGTATESEIVIPATYNGKPVKAINAYAFQYSSKIKSVVIPKSVTSIGNFAFFMCNSITSVTINGGASIGNSAFSNSSLTNITIGSEVASIGDSAFNDCSSLTSVTFENTEDWKVTSGSFKLDLSSDDLSDPTKAAEFLSQSYCKYYTWSRA
ncbi:MAG: leucine-rich repeat domain-containing protein [Clostridia bacterium]|nr:leucine-rich repeat domain-containing protein [Clostridia bacterium]